MSSFVGPNVYLIESFVQKGLYLTLQGGSLTDGVKTVVSATQTDDTKSHWIVALIGVGDSGKEEYILINRASGKFLTTTDSCASQDRVTCTSTSPYHNVCRFAIAPLRNRTGAYWLVPIRDTKKGLGVNGGGKEGGEVETYGNDSTDTDMYWYFHLMATATPNCFDIGRKGPNPEV